MNPILKNILITILALAVGLFINGGLVSLGPYIIDYPDGFDPNDVNSFEKFKDLLPISSYLLALIAHALGTLVGAFIVGKFVTTKNLWFSLGIGGFFLLGGIAANIMISGPAWFAPVDLILCYIPMGLLGWVLAGSKK
jgi:hypothetical protein